MPILRNTDYHADELDALPSASAVRTALLRGDWLGVKNAVPEAAYPVLEKAVREGVCPPDGLDAVLRHKLLFSAPEEIAKWPGIAEGLETRVLKTAETTVSREALIDAVKTRRYTRGRISRALCHGVMGVTKADLPGIPVSARILGFRASARPLLRQMQKHTQKNGFSLYARPAREESALLDCKADDLWRVGAGLPRGETYRMQPVIVYT